MTALLSAISGQFTKALILGAFLPVTVTVAAFLWIVDPPLAAMSQVPDAITQLDKEWRVVLLTLIVVTLSGVLFNMNGTIVRFYSGYPWLETWFGRAARFGVKRKWNRLRDARDAARVVGSVLKRVTPATGDLEASAVRLRNARTALSRELNERYPFVEDRLLPTRLGNVLRNVEEYASQRYGISGVVLWPRLLAKVDAAYAGFIDTHKTAFDFALNMSLLTAVASLMTVWIGLSFQTAWFWDALAFGVISWLFYEASIARAGNWGDAVKSAFDLYRLPLLAQLGYDFKPKSVEEESRIWSGIAVDYSFPDWPGDHQPYGAPAATVPASSATPLAEGAKLEVLRGVRPPSKDPFPQMEAVLQIRNTSTVATAARIIEIPPAGWKFLEGTVADSGANFTMIGEGAPAFVVNAIAPATSRTITYRLQSLVP